MDQWKTNDFSHPLMNPNLISSSSGPPPINPIPDFRTRPDLEAKDPIVARKVQKADREKLRRDKLNEHFLELGKAIDPERPKNDKGTILGDTIQVLKDFTAEVDRLNAEYTALSEESRELTQEKNELREEKASIKSEVDNLHQQYQQRARAIYPWASVDPSMVMAPTYSYPVSYSVPPGTIPMHPGQIPMQPFTFFANQNTGPVPNPCSTFIPYSGPANHQINPTSTQCASSSRISGKNDSKSNDGSDHFRGSNGDKGDDCNDVATELELKTPGSTANKDKSPGERKGKHTHNKEKKSVAASSSNRYKSSQGCNGSSFNSTGNLQS